jgi:glycosyltransferase involved in cell wall biosynthesis
VNQDSIIRQKAPHPLVSIIMNCFNGEKYLREAINSVYAQTYRNWEIVFWDNCSTDHSAEIASSYDTKLKYYLAKETTPLYDARNRAIEKCQGEVVAFLDCDDLWLEDKLEKQIMLYNAGAKFVYGAFELIDQNGNKIEKRLASLKSGKVTNDLLKACFISIGSVLVDMNLMKELKFNPNYNLIGDFDLWLRISLITEFDYVNTVVEKSRQHGSNLSGKLKYQWIVEQRKLYKNLFTLLDKSSLIFLIYYIIKSEIKAIFMRRDV